MNLKKIPESEQLIEIALRRGRKQVSQLPRQKNRLKQEKAIEIRRIEVSANYVWKVLDEKVKDFPNFSELSLFQQEMIKSIVDVDALRKALGQFSATTKILRKLKAQHIVEIKKLGRGREGKAKEASRRFIGRFSSLVKRLGSNMKIYNEAAEKLRELPSIKELPTAIIAGYPNVGKSTLLKKITGSNVKVAAYPFTTNRLELGYFKYKYGKIQVIDTPGLLDRPLEERNKIERKGIAALKHLASLIVFVVDVTESCGFSLEKQLVLLQGIGKEFGGVVVYLSKTDLAEKAQVERAKKELKGWKILPLKQAEIANEIAESLL